VLLRDTSGESDRYTEVKAKVVINATGVWADQLRRKAYRERSRRSSQHLRIRPLRGSHLVLPAERLPITRAVTFLHPKDGRPVFAIPWEGATIFGTTDVDHRSELITDPAISEEEFDYLLSSLQQIFPAQELVSGDIISTFSGLRPVIDTGKEDPSRESREHAIWDEDGLITVTGGKLTTFRLMARDALKIARKYLGEIHFEPKLPLLKHLPEQALALLEANAFKPAQRLRLLGRYGPQAAETFAAVPRTERETIASTPYLWAELRQAACCEGIVHLSDLLLRRVRLGLLLPGGGIDLLDRIRSTVQLELGWDDARWEQEAATYVQLWQMAYSPQRSVARL
jgi:glycerol-3-phosphate dehydrogenase